MNNNPTGFQSFSQLTNGSVELDQADPVQACLPGSFFDTGNNPQRVVKGLCDTFMAQRCSTGNFDQACSIFATSKKNEDFTGISYKKWLKQSLESMFCRPAQNGYCATRCQQFNPQAPASAQVCETVGNVVYRNNDQLYDLSGNVSYLGRLETPSPLKIADCPKVCDVFDLSKLTDDNFILNECLDLGVGLDIIQNLVQNLKSNNVPVTNTRLNNFMSSYIQDGSIKPGFASVGSNAPVITTQTNSSPAVNVNLAPNQVYNVGDVGNFGPNLAQNVSKPVEGYRYRNRRVEESKPKSLSVGRIIAIVIIILVVIYLVYIWFGQNKNKKYPYTKSALHYREW